ncbi:hypothetical protein V500_04380 [Pseudogymnoascus sp. VKM F-4518 (FW-2643)]|nr:hypothetical protein V500_04380 [Pseudogymnoascus sp. VKM F-4518 (FW-2643)]
MSPFYPRKWFIVPHDEYPAATTLPLGQLISSIDTISHSLNRKTLIAPPPREINNTIQTSSSIELFKNRALHADFNASSPIAPAGGNIGGGGERSDRVKMDIDVVHTQIFSPTDDYAKTNFNASRKETEMVNYLKKKKLGLKVPLGSKNVFIVTARKIGKSTTITRDEVLGVDAKAKAGLDVQGAVNVEASLDAEWKKVLRIGGFSEEPCVFAVQVRKVLYHADPGREVTTEQFVKSAVMGKGGGEEENEEEDEDGEVGVEFEGLSEEGPRVDKYDFDIVAMKGPWEEEEFVIKAED